MKETEKELNHTFQLQKQQYEATIQRHLTFIDQVLISTHFNCIETAGISRQQPIQSIDLKAFLVYVNYNLHFQIYSIKISNFIF